jgi:hypothetical protein
LDELEHAARATAPAPTAPAVRTARRETVGSSFIGYLHKLARH